MRRFSAWVEDKGLKKKAIGFASSVVIGQGLVPKRAVQALSTLQTSAKRG